MKDRIQGNIMIAEFMMMPKVEGGLYPISGYLTPPEKLEFHTSWDWLMPVIDKIDKLNFDTTIRHYVQTKKGKKYNSISCEISDSFKQEIRLFGVGESKIESVYNAVVRFIKWYKTKS